MLRGSETLLGLDPPQSQYLEGFRRLRAAVLALHEERTFKSLLVSSASANEGKTTLVLNLATLMAQANLRIIVVDADFVNPTIHRAWELPDAPGCTDACLVEMDVSAILQDTELPGLKAVSAGSMVAAGADLVSSARMPELLAKLCDQADFVLLDSAPILGYAGTLQLARLVDAVVLVARARGNVAPVRRALSLLKDVGRDARGIIVNDILQHDADHYVHYSGSARS